jgi:hypothetical protein
MERHDMLKVLGGLSLFAALMWLIVWLVKRG